MSQYIHNNKITFFFWFFLFFYLHKLSNVNERKARLNDIDAKTRLSNVSDVASVYIFFVQRVRLVHWKHEKRTESENGEKMWQVYGEQRDSPIVFTLASFPGWFLFTSSWRLTTETTEPHFTRSLISSTWLCCQLCDLHKYHTTYNLDFSRKKKLHSFSSHWSSRVEKIFSRVFWLN